MEKYQEGMGKFCRFAKFDVGDGSKISFWCGVWCKDQSLKAAFLKLYSILDIRRLRWQITCSCLTTPYGGTSPSLDQCMIGR